jgi:hypothetical protein
MAFEKLHRDEATALVFANFVDGANVRVIQCRGRPGFPPKTFQGGMVSPKGLGNTRLLVRYCSPTCPWRLS